MVRCNLRCVVASFGFISLVSFPTPHSAISLYIQAVAYIYKKLGHLPHFMVQILTQGDGEIWPPGGAHVHIFSHLLKNVSFHFQHFSVWQIDARYKDGETFTALYRDFLTSPALTALNRGTRVASRTPSRPPPVFVEPLSTQRFWEWSPEVWQEVLCLHLLLRNPAINQVSVALI